MKTWLQGVLYFSQNAVSRAGVILVTFATVLFLYFLGVDSTGGYQDIVQFLLLPAIFVAGLILIPVGAAWQRRREGVSGPTELRLADPRVKQILVFVVLTTSANVVIGAALTYQAHAYIESNNFCGGACHPAMKPEQMAHAASVHSQVNCVECHVGEGLSAEIEAKLNGTRQLIHFVTGTVQKPVRLPARVLETTSQSCERCHDRKRDIGNRVWTSYRYDESGERLDTIMMMHLGGGATGKGIHGAHEGPDMTVKYWAADPARNEVLAVEVTRKGKTTLYQSEGFQKKIKPVAVERQMGCLDCHNRPSHLFDTPERAVDRAFFAGQMDPRIPEIRKAAIEVVSKPYASTAEAQQRIPREILRYYELKLPEVARNSRAAIDRAGTALVALFHRNVFPEMSVSWGTYPLHIGHMDSPGCFRCHGEDLKGPNGETITQDCTVCHQAIAVDEKDPKAMMDLGLQAAMR